ncbi:hypothetical protein Tco_0747487 [Tanacetum coccineum]|uniref:Uncharacterized protein n=1 Tax=Tanacetum coccineum TaxID=301880 RepID=A0ABQ4YTW2_9ASTR
MRVNIPEFNGNTLNPDGFIDWLVAVKEVFEFKEVLENKRARSSTLGPASPNHTTTSLYLSPCNNMRMEKASVMRYDIHSSILKGPGYVNHGPPSYSSSRFPAGAGCNNGEYAKGCFFTAMAAATVTWSRFSAGCLRLRGRRFCDSSLVVLVLTSAMAFTLS